MASEGFEYRALLRTRLASRLGLTALAGLLVACAVGDEPPSSFGAPGYTSADRPNPSVEPLTAGDESGDDTRSRSPGSCCEVTSAGGCLDAVVENCVCQLDRDCCSVGWDATCIVTAQSACGACGGTPPDPFDDNDGGDDDGSDGSTGGDDDEPPPADCCQPTAAAGCGEPALEQCVCALDPVCCQEGWDDLCVQVAEHECGACGGGGSPANPVGPCCEPQAGPGCTAPLLEVCVCTFDPFCCQHEWDAQCVDVAYVLCGACG